MSGFGGTFSEIIANEILNGTAVVTIAPGDAGFESSRCGTWTTDLSRITSSTTAPFAGEGTFIVGVDIAAGTWRSENTSGDCYWKRLSNFGGKFDAIIANGLPSGPAIVAISAADKGFSSARCGTWTKIG